MTSSAEKRLQQTEQKLHEAPSAKAYFEASDAANHAGNTEKATRYLRMAFNTHNNQLMNQYDIKSIGDSNNAKVHELG